MDAADESTSHSQASAGSYLGYATPTIVWVNTGIELTSSRLVGSRLTIGRAEQNQVIVAARGVSRVHCEIVWSSPLWLLRDAQSTNGTFLNGSAVREAPLHPHDVIRVGDAVGVFVTGPGADQAARFRRIDEGLFGGTRFAERLAELHKISTSALSVVLEGETGTGKEQVARAVHRWSGRSGPLVAINCAALPEQLAESELFGHRRGAFTGANEASIGRLRSAQGGTLFLDEVLELPLAVQAKLLRALETREVVALGEARPCSIDIRVICATQSALAESVQRGSFRSDLLARLSEYRFVIPPLRERREDIAGLFAQLLAEACGGHTPTLSAKLVERICVEDWRMNVRQLRSVARQMAVLHSHEAVLDTKHFPEELRSEPGPERPPSESPIASRDLPDLERLECALRSHQGRLGKAAQEARISRQRAQRLLERYPWRDPRRVS